MTLVMKILIRSSFLLLFRILAILSNFVVKGTVFSSFSAATVEVAKEELIPESQLEADEPEAD